MSIAHYLAAAREPSSSMSRAWYAAMRLTVRLVAVEALPGKGEVDGGVPAVPLGHQLVEEGIDDVPRLFMFASTRTWLHIQFSIRVSHQVGGGTGGQAPVAFRAWRAYSNRRGDAYKSSRTAGP